VIFLKKRKLRVDILTIFLTLFLTTVLGIIFYSQSRSNDAILKVANDLIQRTNQSIIEKLDDFLRPTPFVKTASFLLGDNILELSDMESLSSFMHIMLESYPQLINAYLADTKGNIFIENNVSDDPLLNKLIPFISNREIPVNTRYLSESVNRNKLSADLTMEYKNNEGQTLKTEHETNYPYDPRTRPWYLGAQNLTGPWIGIYQFFGTAKHGITIAFPIRTKGKLMGVAAADLSIDLIARELQNFSLSNKGMFFIVNNHNQIISYQQNNSKQEDADELPTLETTKNPLIKTAFETHRKTGKRNFTFNLDNKTYIANFTPYAFSSTENWEIGSVLPIDIFVGSIKNANHNTLFFSMLMLFFGLLLIIYSSHRISQPIIRLTQETKDMIKFKFDKETKINTHIYEVQVMIDALNATKATLSSFAKYVPKVLVEQLLQSRIIAELGGEKREITALFTDIANFTEMSEELDPEFLMLHISEYLNALTQRIQQNKGNIDKYIGDAIMAFWGAPLDDEHHTYHACLAVLACQNELRKMNKEWQAQGKPTLPTRFGLNTGSAIIGNMGSADRLNYTAIGDAINLAARLETLNKIYNTEVIVSESVYEKCAKQFLFRPLDVVQVRGKRQTTVIYELIAENSDGKNYPATREQIELCQLSWEGYNAYQAQDFRGAQAVFGKIAEKFPEDTIAKIYLARSEDRLG
jgi:adenylate cyclase